MSTDCTILFKTTTEDYLLKDWLLADCCITSTDANLYKVDVPWKYYDGNKHDSGPWPKIASVLLTLLASSDVEQVWYFPEYLDAAEPFTVEKFHAYNMQYLSTK